ncbi:MAG TPA: FtsX-like permease family protein [Streptosporangiaceae bacterium]|nr:FtsX-like permease family protein [Streptosporangiaceae bacterium]
MRPLPAIVRTARVERAIFAALGLVVLTTTFLVTAAAPLLTGRYDAAARAAVTDVAPAARDVTLTAFGEGGRTRAPTVRADDVLRSLADQIGAMTPGALRAVTGPVEYTVATRPLPLPAGSGADPSLPDPSRRLLLEWDPGVAARVRYIDGRPPHNPVPRARGRPVVEAGLDAGTMAALRLQTGAELPFTLGSEPVIVRITGRYHPLSAADRYWSARPGHTGPIVRRSTEGTEYTGVGVLDAAGYQTVHDATDTSFDFTWRLPVRPDAFTAARAGPAVDAIARLGATVTDLQVASGLTGALGDFRGQLRTAQAVLSVALTGLFAVAAGVLALVCRLLTERLRAPLATMRARGASLAQLGSGVGAAALLVSLPAAAAGYAPAAALVPGTAALSGALAVLAAATLVPVVLACRAHSGAGESGRTDLVGRRATPRRLVLEGLAVALAGAGVVALRTRGLTTGSADRGADPFLAAVPVLLGCAAGLLTLRAYPYPLRLVGRLTARGRSVVSFVGVARASRQSTVAVLPMIVLLLATAVAGFAGTVESGLGRAQERSAWMATGADARVDGLRLDVAGADRLRRVPGVRDVVPAQFVDGATFSSPSQVIDVTLVAVDLAAYRRLTAGTPIRPPAPPAASAASTRAGSAVPALLSPGLARRAGPGPYTASAGVIPDLSIQPAGTADAFPAAGAGDAFVVVPYRSLGAEATPTMFFVRGTGMDPAGLRRAAGADAVVTTRAVVYDRLTGTPMAALVRTAFGYGTLVVAGYATLAILLALIIGSGPRGQTVSYLRTLGLTRRQARRLAVAEVAPALLCAAVAGWVVGLLLPHVVGPAIDLRPYTGGFAAVGYAPDPLRTAALGAGLIVFAGLAIAIETVISGRRRLGTTLRMGAQT